MKAVLCYDCKTKFLFFDFKTYDPNVFVLNMFNFCKGNSKKDLSGAIHFSFVKDLKGMGFEFCLIFEHFTIYIITPDIIFMYVFTPT